MPNEKCGKPKIASAQISRPILSSALALAQISTQTFRNPTKWLSKLHWLSSLLQPLSYKTHCGNRSDKIPTP